VAFYSWGDEFPVHSTRRQFERYVNWWGTERFKKGLAERGVQRRGGWEEEFGLVDTAKGLVEDPRRNGGRTRRRSRDTTAAEPFIERRRINAVRADQSVER
jgi:hypothetical protein